MRIEDIPFNKLIGIRDVGASVELDCTEEHMNHVGTAHATVIFGIAEACSGKFLIEKIGNCFGDCFAVTRHGEIKYKNPGKGKLKAEVIGCEPSVELVKERLEARRVAKIAIDVRVFVGEEQVADSRFVWFLKRDQ